MSKYTKQTALEKAYELLLVPDMYHTIDGAFDTDALHLLEEALGAVTSGEIRERIYKHFGEDCHDDRYYEQLPDVKENKELFTKEFVDEFIENIADSIMGNDTEDWDGNYWVGTSEEECKAIQFKKASEDDYDGKNFNAFVLDEGGQTPPLKAFDGSDLYPPLNRHEGNKEIAPYNLYMPEISQKIKDHPIYEDLAQKMKIEELEDELSEYKELLASLEEQLEKRQLTIDSLTDSMVKVLMATHKK